MFRELPKVIELLERLVRATERMADAQEIRNEIEERSEAQRSIGEESERIRLRNVAENGLETVA